MQNNQDLEVIQTIWGHYEGFCLLPKSYGSVVLYFFPGKPVQIIFDATLQERPAIVDLLRGYLLYQFEQRRAWQPMTFLTEFRITVNLAELGLFVVPNSEAA